MASLLLPVCAADAFCKDKVNIVKKVNVEGTATVTFLGAGGQSISVECPKDTYILDAGLDAGVELPYTCRGGICGACVGRVASGETDPSDIDDLTFVLSQDEIDQGMALLCMTRPVSDVTVETQSDWGYSLGVADWKGPSGHIGGKDPNHLMT
ncbi:hypothetical protein WJX81_001882 [Elliptochloris bilobata]|uniref:2Fe-2S ferredoxin-type domain-containing protein n=1 Tax=Elliptochloris bilobata TaxID=381761 RepID=A0AAW1S1E9_9CHLO